MFLREKFREFYRISLHRQLLENCLRENSALVKGKVLEIGSKNRRYDYLFNSASGITAIDINPEAGKDIIKADAASLPFAAKSFDTVISFEVFEYIKDISIVLKEIARVLNNDGTLIFSVPLLNPVHGDIDIVRYTLKGWEELLEEQFNISVIRIIGGRHSLIWDVYFEKVRNYYGTARKVLLYPWLAFTKKIALISDNRKKSNRFPMGYFFVCRNKYGVIDVQ